MDAWHGAKYQSLTKNKKICMTVTPVAEIKPWSAHKIAKDNYRWWTIQNAEAIFYLASMKDLALGNHLHKHQKRRIQWRNCDHT